MFILEAPLAASAAPFVWLPVIPAIAGALLLFAAARARRMSWVFWVLGGVSIAATLWFMATATVDQQTAENAQASAVSAWLADDYGIDLDRKQSVELEGGTSFVVDYDGTLTAISILETANGRLSVVDSQMTVLLPVG